TSVISSVCIYSPRPLPPSCPTKSISIKPGLLLFQSAKVRIGIWFSNSVPGLVGAFPFNR
ncbi:MAG: hypothetical protein ABIK33_06075, partial [candidate division WOR-3 bacterium]